MPGGNATLGRLQSNTWSDTTNYGVRAREELKLTQSLTAVAGIGWETTTLKGVNSVYKYPVTDARPTFFTISADRQFQNTAPEFALLYQARIPNGSSGRASPLVTARRKSETSSCFPMVRTATTRSFRRSRTSATISVSTGRRTMH